MSLTLNHIISIIVTSCEILFPQGFGLGLVINYCLLCERTELRWDNIEVLHQVNQMAFLLDLYKVWRRHIAE